MLRERENEMKSCVKFVETSFCIVYTLESMSPKKLSIKKGRGSLIEREEVYSLDLPTGSSFSLFKICPFSKSSQTVLTRNLRR
jgi:hypothetical protein